MRRGAGAWVWAAALAAGAGGARAWTGGAGAQARGRRAALRNAVLQALIADPEVGQYPLDAGVDAHGRVELNGALPSKKDRDRAVRVAKHVPGVHGVEDKIAVNPAVLPLTGAAVAPARRGAPGTTAAAAENADLQAAMLNALAAKPELRGVRVAVDDGAVVLTGQTGTRQARDEAAVIAGRNAAGRKLENKIEVRGGGGGAAR